MIEIGFKKLHKNASTPQLANDGDAGFDLVATSMVETEQYIHYGLGLAFAIPKGYGMFLFPRSSVSKKDLCLANCVGVIDSGYRGEVAARFRVTSDHTGRKTFEGDPLYRVGDRVVQAIILKLPSVSFVETDDLGSSDRGEGGFGSSGK